MKNHRKQRKSSLGIAAAFCLFLLSAAVCIYGLYSLPQEQASPVSYGDLPQSLEIPLCKGHSSVTDHQVCFYKGFALCYRESYELSEWVAYKLDREELVGENSRKDNFRIDTNITTGSSNLDDYKGTGYDRGHLAPAGDFHWDGEALSESFLMSNMSPQVPAFNRGIWKQLEEKARKLADTYGSLYIVTGPVLEKSASQYKTIGQNHVVVPEFFYKVFLAKTPQGICGIGFIIPNEKSQEPLENFTVPIDKVEERTGLDFFSLLEDDIEDNIEAKVNLSDWF